MMGKTHRLVALTGGVLTARVLALPPEQTIALTAAAGVTAKLPDIDCKIWWLEHRGPLTHSLLAWLVFTVLAVAGALLVSLPAIGVGAVAAGLSLGVLLHVLADALTISGVPLFWPLDHRDRHLLPKGLRIRTAGHVEPLLTTLLALGFGLLIVTTYGT